MLGPIRSGRNAIEWSDPYQLRRLYAPCCREHQNRRADDGQGHEQKPCEHRYIPLLLLYRHRRGRGVGEGGS